MSLNPSSRKRKGKRKHFQVEPVTYWTLNVTVLRARTQQSHDYWSESDLYVMLMLPTATARTQRTKTVSNNNNPDWNESFTFRVPTQVKNILEMKLYDEDPFSRDDLVSTVLLDLGTLEVGTRETKVFSLDPESKDVLEMDFLLLLSEEKTLDYPSNGILMAAPLSVLDVNVGNLSQDHTVGKKVLKLNGAYRETQTLNPEEKEKLRFFVNRDLETELGLSAVAAEDEPEALSPVMLSSVPLQPLPPQLSTKVSLTLEQDTVDLHLESQESAKENLHVRLSCDVPAAEKDFLRKRRLVVAEAVQKLLGLTSSPSPEQVPTVALVASGGGTRAMTGFLGSLKGLKEAGVLDAVTYMTGVSGSTWAMSTLTQEQDWSQTLDSVVLKARKQMTKSVLSVLSFEKMIYYSQEMAQKEREGHLVSYIDMVGLILEHLVFGQKNSSTLSEQKKTVNRGQNPFPIYTAVNVKEAINGHQSEAEWCEFTPFEVGLQKYGAFVRTEDFGSEYFLGHLIKKLPELRVPFLIGIWSSVFSVNLKSLWKCVTGSEPQWTPEQTDVENIEVDNEPSTLDTFLLNPVSSLSGMFTDFFKKRPIIAELFNFTRGLFLHDNYSKHNNFVAWKDDHPDAFPNQLTPSDSTLRLIDSGHAINIGCVPVLRPERAVDVLIVLNYSWDPQHIFRVLEVTAAYCEDHRLPFPRADFTPLQQQPQKEVYIFEDEDNPRAPIVVHFPLVNVSFRDFKSPGVKRKTKQELAAGSVDVSSSGSPYKTQNLTYSETDYDALIDLTKYNVLNNKDALVSALNRALQRKQKL